MKSMKILHDQFVIFIILLLSSWSLRSISKVLPADVFKLAVISKAASPIINFLLERDIFFDLIFLLSKNEFTLGDAVFEITDSLNTFTGKTFEINLKDQEESSNIYI